MFRLFKEIKNFLFKDLPCVVECVSLFDNADGNGTYIPDHQGMLVAESFSSAESEEETESTHH